MKKFSVEFKHTIEETYVVTVEAETEKEAKELVEENPFEFVEEGQQPIDVQGLNSEIIDVQEVD